jgi:hypothetical protein
MKKAISTFFMFLIAFYLLGCTESDSPNQGSSIPKRNTQDLYKNLFKLSPSHEQALENSNAVNTVSAARELLSSVGEGTVRDFFTYDFGRARDASGISIILKADEGKKLLPFLRKKLGDQLVAFNGTNNWLGDERHAGEEFVIAPGRSQFDILRLARSDACNYDMATEDLIKKLQKWDQDFGIDIIQASTDTVVFLVKSQPKDILSFGKELCEFCPDLEITAEDVKGILQESPEIYLWWD